MKFGMYNGYSNCFTLTVLHKLDTTAVDTAGSVGGKKAEKD